MRVVSTAEKLLPNHITLKIIHTFFFILEFKAITKTVLLKTFSITSIHCHSAKFKNFLWLLGQIMQTLKFVSKYKYIWQGQKNGINPSIAQLSLQYRNWNMKKRKVKPNIINTKDFLNCSFMKAKYQSWAASQLSPHKKLT